MEDKKARIEWIDYAKVIGIWLVVLGHILNSGRYIESDMYNVIYSFHMPFFFFISGILFSTKEMPFSLFVKDKIKKLIVPYFLLNLLCVVLCVPLYLYPEVFPTSNYHDFVPDVCTLVDGELGSAFSRPSWFLLSLFIVMLMSYWAVKLKTYWQLLIAGIGVGLTYIATIYEIPLNLDTIPGGFVFFLMGYIMRNQMRKTTPLNKWVLLGLTIIIVALHICLAIFNGKVAINHIIGTTVWLYWIVAVIGIMALCMFANTVSTHTHTHSKRFVQIISTGTILILCIHEILIDYTMDFFLVNHSFHIPLLIREMILATVIIVLCVPIIMFMQRYCPILIGNRK